MNQAQERCGYYFNDRGSARRVARAAIASCATWRERSRRLHISRPLPTGHDEGDCGERYDDLYDGSCFPEEQRMMKVHKEAHHVLLWPAGAKHGARKRVGVNIGRVHLGRFSGRNGKPLERIGNSDWETHAAHRFRSVYGASGLHAGVEVQRSRLTMRMHQCGETEPLKLEAKDHSAAGQTDKQQ